MADASTRKGRLLALFASAVLASACALPFSSGGGGDGAPDAPSPAVGEAAAETRAALATLERMSAFLASRDAFRFHAVVRYDAVQDSGQRIEFGQTREVAVRRPDRLRIDAVDWDGENEILSYDGAHLWLASPPRRAYSRIEQTGELEQVLDRLAIEYDSPTPLAELIGPDLYARMSPAVVSAGRVGIVRLDGRLCEQLAFRGTDVDFQLFVEQGENPVPRRLVIDYREEPGAPQYRADLVDWDLSPVLSDAYFRVSPPTGAQRVPLEELLELVLGGEPDRTARGGVR